MKLLIATGLYPPDIGGPATYTALLEEKLPGYGHEVSVLPFAVSRHLPKIIRHAHYFVSLMKQARSVDVIYAQDTVSVGFPALLAAKVLRKPFIVRVPGDYAWEQAVQRYGVTDTIDEFQSRRQSWRVRILQALQRQVVTRSTLTVTPSRYFQTLVAGWGVAPEKNVTIYNGVDLAIKPDQVQRPAGRLMVTAGRLVEWKGIDGLISLLPDLPDWSLVVIGDGPLRQSLEQQATRLAVADRVQFVGSIPRTEVFGWCVAADAFVLNTSFESFSYQVVEAMYSGTPTIVTNVGSLPELITDGVDGVLVAPDDLAAIRSHVLDTNTNPSVWKNRTQNAKVRVQKFTIAHCMQKLNQELQKIV